MNTPRFSYELISVMSHKIWLKRWVVVWVIFNDSKNLKILENLNIRVWTELTRGSELFPNHWIVIDKWIKNYSLSLEFIPQKVPIQGTNTLLDISTTQEYNLENSFEPLKRDTCNWKEQLEKREVRKSEVRKARIFSR